jgi:hypothetical protein
VAAGIFVTVHVANYYNAYGQILRRAEANYPLSPAGRLTVSHEMIRFGIWAFATYVAWALIGATIAAKTRDRILWTMPILVYVLSPLPAMMVLQDRPAFRLILDPYDVPGGGPGAGRWAFLLLHLALVLLPGAVVALRMSEPRPRADGHARVAFLLCGVLGILVYMRQRYVTDGTFQFNVETHLTLVILFIVGAALGVKRGWFPWVHVALAFLFSEAFYIASDWIDPLEPPIFSAGTHFRLLLMALLPQLVAVGLGALSDPLARYLRSRRGRQPALTPQTT